MLVVFPLFVLGFVGAYTLILDRPVAFEAARLLRWGEALEWAPAQACGRAETLVWTQEDQLWIVPPAASQLRATLAVGGRPVTAARTVLCRAAPPSAATSTRAAKLPQPATGSPIQAGPDGAFALPRGVGLWVQLGGENDFALQLFDGPRLLPEGSIRLGATGATPSDDGRVDGARDLWWLLAAIVIHLGLVALPEEHFFRGYLLPRLDQLCGRPRRLFGVPIGWGLVLSSLAFALLHPILIPGPHRLLVFFPALLFGWLRAKSGKLGAPILVHAASNILLAIVSRMVG
jgi:membrane protease YdiL (CAAX protease family)